MGSSQQELEQNGIAGVLEMRSFFHCSEKFAWRKSSLCEEQKKKNSELPMNSHIFGEGTLGISDLN